MQTVGWDGQTEKKQKRMQCPPVDDYGWKRSTDGWIPVVGLFAGWPWGICQSVNASWILARKERADGGARRWAGRSGSEFDGAGLTLGHRGFVVCTPGDVAMYLCLSPLGVSRTKLTTGGTWGR